MEDLPEPKADRLWGEWKWDWNTNANDEADCGVYTETIIGHAYAIVRCPRYLTKEQWAQVASHICELHNASLRC
jgi:hypothetical protein